MPAKIQTILQAFLSSFCLPGCLFAGICFPNIRFICQTLLAMFSNRHCIPFHTVPAHTVRSFFYGRKAAFLLAGYWLKIPQR